MKKSYGYLWRTAWAVGFVGFLVVLSAAGCRTVPPDVMGEVPREFPGGLTKAVRKAPRENLPRLIAYIEEQAETEREKVRLAHDWVAVNIAYDTASYYGGGRAVTDACGVIRKGGSVCAGYANVMQRLLDELGVENRLLSGYARGGSYRPFEEADRDPQESNHAWNAVRLEGQWHLIDSTWNAGYVDNREFHFAYNHDQYLADPWGFLHLHFNPQEKWQLVDEPVSFEEFTRMPALWGSFFRLGLEPDATHERITRLEGQAEDTLVFDRVLEEYDLQFLVSLSRLEGKGAEAEVDRRFTLADRRGEKVRIRVRFPGDGRYRLQLGAWRDETDTYYSLGEYLFVTQGLDEMEEKPGPFVRLYSLAYETGIEDLQPREGGLPAEDPGVLRFRAPATEGPFYLRVDGEYRRLRPKEAAPEEEVPEEAPAVYAYSLEEGLDEGDSVILTVKSGDSYRYLAVWEAGGE